MQHWMRWIYQSVVGSIFLGPKVPRWLWQSNERVAQTRSNAGVDHSINCYTGWSSHKIRTGDAQSYELRDTTRPDKFESHGHSYFKLQMVFTSSPTRKTSNHNFHLSRGIADLDYFLSFASCTVSIILSTTDGSARVEVSPSWSSSPARIFRRMRRMILPDRVLGRSGMV